MGGSKPSAPVTYMPTPTAPTLYNSVIPEEDFVAAADYLARMKADRDAIRKQRYQEVGTPGEIGARQAGIREQEAASYSASLPRGTQYEDARKAAEARLNKARIAAAELAAPDLEKQDVTPTWGTQRVG